LKTADLHHSDAFAGTKPGASSVISNSKQSLATEKYRYCFVDPRFGEEWDRLVGEHPDHEVFHSSAWARVLCNTYGHKPFYLHISDENGSVVLLPLIEVAGSLTGRRGICLPFSDFCGPLYFADFNRPFLFQQLTELARKNRWRFFEVRDVDKPHGTANPSATFYCHQINLDESVEKLFTSFASSVRGAIRKAVKGGITAEVGDSLESVRTFYQLHLRTRRRHGLPPQPFRFFQNLQEELLRKKLGFVLLARAASRPIAGAIFLRTSKRGLYKYAASDERYQQFRGNDLVLWEGIKFLAETGARSLHLGRTSLDNSGLRRFKLGWGGTEQMLHYFRFDPGRNSWLTEESLPGTWHKRFFGRLPLRLNQLAGAMIYPQLD
jgi:lipid II:glycine glycyltransferase (peptidoglycan interpeptide bridge formation enzyme)